MSLVIEGDECVGVSDLTPQSFFFFFIIFYFFPGPQAEDAERGAPGAELTYSFTGSCYSFIRIRSMWERREEWARGKLALQIYVLSGKKK